MGGSGSGNFLRQGGRETCESMKSIELPVLRKQGMLNTGRKGVLTWSRDGKPTGSIRVEMTEKGLELDYRYQEPHSDEWIPVREQLRFSFTAQHLGGERRWFICPSCGGRCAVVYGGVRFRCRKCSNLAYQSQNEAPHFRALTQAQKFRQRLGGSLCTDDPFPEKPKGMHWRIYASLVKRGEALAYRAERAGLARFGRLLGKWH